MIQCLIQRNFNYATKDIRDCYKIVKEKLYMREKTKIMFILHSQGGIEGSMIIDWLLQEVPQDLLAKLEIYTFGNAANHFNNPHQHVLSQYAALSNPDSAYTTKTTTHIHYHDPLPATDDDQVPNIEKPFNQKSVAGKSIRYIEHYANTSDFVALWGVLAYIRKTYLTPTAPRYMGRVFERAGRGHQLNQHYLDNMFPLQKSVEVKGGIGNSGFEGAADESAFMDTIVEWDRGDDKDKGEREGLAMSYLATKGEPLDRGEEETLVNDMSPISPRVLRNALDREFENGNDSTSSSSKVGTNGRNRVQFRVKDLSRLWAYRNGRSPKKDETDVGLARMATI